MTTPPDEGALPGYPVVAAAVPRPIIAEQHWCDVTFVHWPVRPETVASRYPAGTRPDVFADGLTYVGLVPFQMRRTTIGRAVRLPYFGGFAETNVRLYSIDEAGRHGVVFRSLETSRLARLDARRLEMRCMSSGSPPAAHAVILAAHRSNASSLYAPPYSVSARSVRNAPSLPRKSSWLWV